MCNTNDMKKVALLIPLVFLITSCEGFNMGYDNAHHSAGIEGGSSTSKQTYTESYTYFAGDPINTEDKSVAYMTFSAPDGLSMITPEKVDELANCDVNDLYAGAVETLNVGTREDNWLFIGASSSYTDGYLILGFNASISDVIIEATPYYYEDTSWNDDKLVVDEGVCVAVNDSAYIKLSTQLTDDKDAVRSTDCRYHLAQGQNQIKIKVGGQKAFIKKITLYF